MAARFDAPDNNNQALSIPLPIGDLSQGYLIHAAGFWESSEGRASLNSLVSAQASANNRVWSLHVNNTSRPAATRNVGSGNHGVGGNAFTGTITDDAWFSSAAYYPPTDGAVNAYASWFNNEEHVGSSNANLAGDPLTQVFIGQRPSTPTSEFSEWHGYIAEVAIWVGISEEDALAIGPCLGDDTQVFLPNAAPVAPTFYYPLLNDGAEANGGPTLVNLNGVTFDNLVHPAVNLVFPAKGGAPVMPIVAML